MKRKFAMLLSMLVLACVGTVGSITQASAHEKAHSSMHSQECVGPAGYCTPYFGS